jgi:hypothetical protein
VPTDKERYRFDLDGYLVVPNALDADRVRELNDVVDRLELASAETRAVGFFDRDPAFRELLVNPAITPYLLEWLGPGLRLDHYYLIFGETLDGLQMHLGGTPYVPWGSYHVRNGRIFSALTVVSYVLNPVKPGEGFACVPGSHKSEFPCPDDVTDLRDRSFITAPTVEPGDAIIFTEALTHGALPWTSAHGRRALLYKFTPGHVTWLHPRWSQELLDACTPEQRAFLEPAYVADWADYFGDETSDVHTTRLQNPA